MLVSLCLPPVYENHPFPYVDSDPRPAGPENLRDGKAKHKPGHDGKTSVLSEARIFRPCLDSR